MKIIVFLKIFCLYFLLLGIILLGNMLESSLEEYWINKMECPDYIDRVLKHHNYWKDNLADEFYRQYVVFHKSEEGKSINLAESERATRFVSIHSSKGDGRKVVFVLGLSEDALKVYSYDKNLIYESMLSWQLQELKKKCTLVFQMTQMIYGDVLVSLIQILNAMRKKSHL